MKNKNMQFTISTTLQEY